MSSSPSSTHSSRPPAALPLSNQSTSRTCASEAPPTVIAPSPKFAAGSPAVLPPVPAPHRYTSAVAQETVLKVSSSASRLRAYRIVASRASEPEL
jgi:hypothetical protein